MQVSLYLYDLSMKKKSVPTVWIPSSVGICSAVK